MTLRTGTLVTIAATTLMLAACGSGDDAKPSASASTSAAASSSSVSASPSTSASASESSSAATSTAATSTAAAGGSGAEKTYDDAALGAIIAKSDGAAGAMKPVSAAEVAQNRKRAAAARDAAAKSQIQPAACADASKRSGAVYDKGKVVGEAMSTATKPANVTSLMGFSSVADAEAALADLHDTATACRTLTMQTAGGKVTGTTNVTPLDVAGAEGAEMLVQDMAVRSTHQKSAIAHARVGTVVIQSMHLLGTDTAGATKDLQGVVKTLLADQK